MHVCSLMLNNSLNLPLVSTLFGCTPSQQSSRPANSVVQSSGAGIWAVLGTLLYPLLAVWRFLSSFLFAAPPPPGAAHPSNSYTNSTSASDKAKRWGQSLLLFKEIQGLTKTHFSVKFLIYNVNCCCCGSEHNGAIQNEYLLLQLRKYWS